MFSTLRRTKFILLIVSLSSANTFNLDLCKVLSFGKRVNPLPNDKIKAFEDDKLNITEMTISLSDQLENTMGGEIAGY